METPVRGIAVFSIRKKRKTFRSNIFNKMESSSFQSIFSEKIILNWKIKYLYGKPSKFLPSLQQSLDVCECGLLEWGVLLASFFPFRFVDRDFLTSNVPFFSILGILLLMMSMEEGWSFMILEWWEGTGLCLPALHQKERKESQS